MPEISTRGLEMPESPIRKLAPLAVDAKKRGVKVYHLNIGQPDLPTPQVGLDALKHIDRSVLEYSPSQGYYSYRERLTVITSALILMCRQTTSSLQPVVLKRCFSRSCRALTRATKSSSLSQLTPTIWPLLFRLAQRSAQSPQP